MKIAGRRFKRKKRYYFVMQHSQQGAIGAKIYICSTNDKLIEEKSMRSC